MLGISPRLRVFAAGMLCVFLGETVINRTALADWFVAPLLVRDTVTEGAAGDAIVVLGAGAQADCSPNDHALRRVIVAARLFHQNRAPLIVFSGGQSGSSACNLALSMAEFAEQLGVPASCMRLESHSTNTWANAERSDAILRVLGATRVILVTDQLHMPRASALFESLGYVVLRAAVPANVGHRNNVDMLALGLHEYSAAVVYAARGGLSRNPLQRALVGPVTTVDRVPTMGSAMDDTHNGQPIVVIGASYAADWQPGPIRRRQVLNKGVGGQQSFEVLERFGRDSLAERPVLVIIWGFINDVFRANANDMAGTLARTRASIDAMVREARSRNVEPVLATEVTIAGPASWSEPIVGLVASLLGRRSYQERINRHVMDQNEWIRELCRRDNLLLLDFERVLAGRGGIRRRAYALADGSHISSEGYRALTEYAAPILERRLEAIDASRSRAGQQD